MHLHLHTRLSKKYMYMHAVAIPATWGRDREQLKDYIKGGDIIMYMYNEPYTCTNLFFAVNNATSNDIIYLSLRQVIVHVTPVTTPSLSLSLSLVCRKGWLVSLVNSSPKTNITYICKCMPIDVLYS